MDSDLAVKVEVPLLVGVEVVQLEVNLGMGFGTGVGSVGDNKSLSVEFSAASPEWRAMPPGGLGSSVYASWECGGRRAVRLVRCL